VNRTRKTRKTRITNIISGYLSTQLFEETKKRKESEKESNDEE
jgi:ribosomal protein S17E